MTSEMLSALAKATESSLRVIVLDVGHGNCAIVQDGPEVAVIDAPKTLVLPLCLEMQANPTVRHLILSHADEDHIGGAQALLAHDTIRINELWTPSGGKRRLDRARWDCVLAGRRSDKAAAEYRLASNRRRSTSARPYQVAAQDYLSAISDIVSAAYTDAGTLIAAGNRRSAAGNAAIGRAQAAISSL